MEESLNYFKPEISDLHVGYECEQLWTTKYNAGTDSEYVEERWVLQSIEYFIGRNLDLSRIRVPYLTKEQIEKEGWIKRTGWFDKEEKQRLGWMPDYELQTDFGSLRLYIRDLENPWKHISIEKYTKSSGEPWSMSSFEPVFRGSCKDINTFRKICKLLGI